MGEITYLLGAGINRSVRGPDGLLPPLAHDFFRQALRHPLISHKLILELITPLFDFIEKYWHMTQDELKDNDFDLEECFTLLELQRRDAVRSKDQDAFVSTSRLEWFLTQLLLDYMSEVEHWFFNSAEFQAFGKRLFLERATVITFNYDSLLESAIEAASPPRLDAIKALSARDPMDNVISDEDIGYSFREWNPYVAYKVKFDEVELLTPGITRMVEGTRYYGHARNQEDLPAFLKMHGSLGWFFHSGYRVDGIQLEGEGASQTGRSVLRRGFYRLGHPNIDYTNTEILLPLIITPVLNKPYDQHPVFLTVWEQAQVELRQCKRLVIGGYSFPKTDFHVRRLLREVFSENSPEELCIINPNTTIVRVAKDLCNHKKPVMVCKDVEEFLKMRT